MAGMALGFVASQWVTSRARDLSSSLHHSWFMGRLLMTDRHGGYHS